jgi:competence protein ComEA
MQAVAGKLTHYPPSSSKLQLLPGVGPSKADRIVVWRKKNGNFKRVADLRKVKGFGYKTLKKLEPFLDIKGETTIAVK